MDSHDLRDIYLAELQEAWSFEQQITTALIELADRATSTDLQTFLKEDAAESANHRDALQRVLAGHDAAPHEHHDASMAAILKEAGKWADRIEAPAVRDAALIASMQRVQHYEIAVYGTLATWARQQHLDEDLAVLLTVLEEEKAADAKLSDLAKQDVNRQAA